MAIIFKYYFQVNFYEAQQNHMDNVLGCVPDDLFKLTGQNIGSGNGLVLSGDKPLPGLCK